MQRMYFGLVNSNEITGNIAVATAKTGNDIYGEKPFSHSLLEGRAMRDAIERCDRI